MIEYYGAFKFRYVEDYITPGAVRIYIEYEPSYDIRNMSTLITHRWPANRDGFTHPPYICIKEEFKPKSQEAATKLAHDWADRTWQYILTGISISEQIRKG